MTAEQPKVSPTGRYSISQTCKLLGIHRNSLRNYTLQGKIKVGIRKSTGRKFYLGTEIIKLWSVSI